MSKYIEKPYNYVYLITCIETKEFYYGSRACNCAPVKDIKYYGSPKKWVLPPKEKLKKEIIQIFSTRDEAFLFERELIIKTINDPLSRNYMIPNTTFHFSGKVVVKTSDGKNIVISNKDPLFLDGTLKSAHIGEGNGMYRKSDYQLWTEKYGKKEADLRQSTLNKKRSENTKGDKNPMFQKTLYDVWLEEFGKEGADKRMEEYKLTMSESCTGEKNGMFGISLHDLWISKHGKEIADKKLKEYGDKHRGVSPPNKGIKGVYCWIYNLGIKQNKQIKIIHLDIYVNNGWIRGRKKFI